MSVRYTKALRQKLIREFAENNGGVYDPAKFLAYVRKVGEKHPAYGWFEWNDDAAANEYRLDQARDFARGLVIRFEVRTVRRGKFNIVEQTMPFAMSPVDGRKNGGGYFITAADDPAHMEEHCRQAAQSLRWFISRYHAAITHVGGNLQALEKLQLQLAPADESQEAAA